MKFKTVILLTCLSAMLLFSFSGSNKINSCYISFKTASNLKAINPDRLPEGAEKVRKVNTDKGEVEVTCIDGYRLLYLNKKEVPFVNLKVELSDLKSYEEDKKNILANLKYLTAQSETMETKDLIELNFNGYKVHGLSRGTIESGSTLGIFVLFPGDGITVYFYFNNLRPEFRNFENLDDYKKQRDLFIEEYTKFLTTCNNK